MDDSKRARPEQDDSFERGIEEKPDPPEEELEPDFARGLRHGEPGEKGRFSEGIEQDPDDPEKRVERDFGEGIERKHDRD